MFKNKNVDFTLCIISSLAILIAVILLALYPNQANHFIEQLFAITTRAVGIPLLWFGFLTFIYCLYIGIRYGHLQLGEGKADFSIFNYVSMIICAGLGSAFVIWSLIEWVYYYDTPALGIIPKSSEAAEWATAYNFFHWGFIPWATFLIAAIPMTYAFYIRKIPALRLSTVCEAMIGNKSYTKFLGKVIEFTFIFSVVGGLSVTLGLGIPMISESVAHLLNFEPTFSTNIITTLIIAAIFTLSSYIGIDKGMQLLSSFNIYFAILCLMLIFFIGPTYFIMSETTNGLSLMLQNFIRMSLNTDPIDQGGFPQTWTMFFYALGIVYAGLMALFITKISRGRSMREMIFTVLFAGPFGCFLFFGINGSFSMDLHLNGQIDMIETLFNEGNGKTIIALLETLPSPQIAVTSFLILITLFLATSLDSAAFSLSAATTPKLENNENTSPILRLFWCILLTIIPLGMSFIGAPLSTLQTVAIIAALPLLVVLIYMNYGFIKWIKEDSNQDLLSQQKTKSTNS